MLCHFPFIGQWHYCHKYVTKSTTQQYFLFPWLYLQAHWSFILKCLICHSSYPVHCVSDIVIGFISRIKFASLIFLCFIKCSLFLQILMHSTVIVSVLVVLLLIIVTINFGGIKFDWFFSSSWVIFSCLFAYLVIFNWIPLVSVCIHNHGQKSLVGYSLWGHKELDMTEWLSTHTLIPINSAEFIC